MITSIITHTVAGALGFAGGFTARPYWDKAKARHDIRKNLEVSLTKEYPDLDPSTIKAEAEKQAAQLMEQGRLAAQALTPEPVDGRFSRFAGTSLNMVEDLAKPIKNLPSRIFKSKEKQEMEDVVLVSRSNLEELLKNQKTEVSNAGGNSGDDGQQA